MITTIIDIITTIVIISFLFLNQRVNKQIKEKVAKLQDLRDIATIIALKLIKEEAIANEDFEAVKKITEMLTDFESEKCDVIIESKNKQP